MLDEVFRIGEPEEKEAFSGLPPRHPDFLWLDVTTPTREELDALTKEHGLPASSVHDCLEPFHLPKVERISDGLFVLLRAFDETSAPDADTMQALTRKLAVFWRSGLLVTVHRKPQRFLVDLKLQLPGHLPGREPYAEAIGLELASGVLQSYRKPLEDAEKAVSEFEEHIFENEEVTELIRKIHLLKRRVTVIRWMVRRTQELLQDLRPAAERHLPAYQDLKDLSGSLYFAADELLDDVNNLLNMQLALASHRTSEVMRVLTIFSVFFMPLTFIVGIYGMNFEHMPELKHAWGYPAAWGVMLLSSAAIFAWFRRKGWLK